MAVTKPIPGQSNNPDPAKRLVENALIRDMRTRARMRSLGYPTKQVDAKIKRVKKRLY